MIGVIIVFLTICATGMLLRHVFSDASVFGFSVNPPVKNGIFLPLSLCVIGMWCWRSSFRPSVSPMPTITAHDWMIDSITRNGKLTYKLDRERFDRKQAEIHGYSFHSDGRLNSINAHIGAGTQSPVGKHQFRNGLLTLTIEGNETQVYRFRRTADQLMLSNHDRTIWLSHYSDRYLFGFNRKSTLSGILSEK